MITTMRGCVAHNDFWPWSISSRSFGLDLENRVRSVASTNLNGFFLYMAQMIAIIRGCVSCYIFFGIWKFEFLGKFLKFFGLDLEKKNLQFWMDSFHRVSSGQGKVREIPDLAKVREFCWRSGKKWILGKVREKSGNLHLVQSKL